MVEISEFDFQTVLTQIPLFGKNISGREYSEAILKITSFLIQP